MTTIETSVIIPTHNRKNVLSKCIKAIDNQNYQANKYEIIIINDGSTDDTDEFIKSIETKAKLRYKYQKQSGPSKARNEGIRIADGKYIVFIDDDIIVTPDFLDAHIKAQKKEEKIIVQGPVIYTNNLDNPQEEEMKITDYSRAYFATGNVSIKKKYLEKVGFFNETFTEYGWEDLELGRRLKKLKLKVIKEPIARGFHLKHSFSPEKINYYLDREKQRGRTAVIFHNIDPTFGVKMMTFYWKPFFIIEKVLNIFNWPQKTCSHKALKYFHEKNLTSLRNLILSFMKLHAYFNGMREESDQLPE